MAAPLTADGPFADARGAPRQAGRPIDPVRDAIRESLVGAYLFAIGLCAFVDLRFVGRILLPELLLLAGLPLLLAMRGPALALPARWLLGGAAAWLVGLVATDLVVGTEAGDFLRGWARVVVLAGCFVALGRLLDRPSRFALLLCAIGAGTTIEAFGRHASFAEAWKFGASWGCFCMSTGAVLWAAAHRTGERVPSPSVVRALAAIAFGVAVVSLAVNTRSIAATMLLTSLLLLLHATDRSRARLRAGRGRRAWLLLPAGLAISYAIGWAYVSAADAGWLGEATRIRLRMQLLDAFDPVLGLLLGGRAELFASIRAIADAPLLGHGSWAKSATYYEILLENLKRFSSREMYEMAIRAGAANGYIIPTHSHVLGSWVEAGIAGGLFWLLVQATLVAAALRASLTPSYWSIAMLCLVVTQTWSIWFSPLDAESRLFWGLALVAACRALAGPPPAPNPDEPAPTGPRPSERHA